MTSITDNKLNHLLTHMPRGVVLTQLWLSNHGISSKLAWWYTQSPWLERIGQGAYKAVGENITWLGALSAVQQQLGLPVHVGAKTALELLGQAHFVPISGIKRVLLFKGIQTKLPAWFIKAGQWDAVLLVSQSSLFGDKQDKIGLIQREIDHITITLSSPERAAIELLSLVPHKQAFDEAVQLIEGLNQLRPSVLQGLLECCQSVKAKRLLLYLADRFQHPWLPKLDLKKIDLGSGKRVIGSGGYFNSKYQLSVPSNEEE